MDYVTIGLTFRIYPFLIKVRLLSLIRGGVSSLDTVAITLELLVAASAFHGSTHLGNGNIYDQVGSSSNSSGSVHGGGADDQRRQGWARAGASAALQCLGGIGVIRKPGVRNGERREGISGASSRNPLPFPTQSFIYFNVITNHKWSDVKRFT